MGKATFFEEKNISKFFPPDKKIQYKIIALDIVKTPKNIGEPHMKSNYFDEMSNMSMS